MVIGKQHIFQVSDLGENEFFFKTALLDKFDTEEILALRTAATCVPHFSEVTLGCKCKYE
jgi:hypothetical protein